MKTSGDLRTVVHGENEWRQTSRAWFKINVIMGRRSHLFLLLFRYHGL